jgi:NADPH:quinone reductase-like Zn-dependent oxidoreductase
VGFLSGPALTLEAVAFIRPGATVHARRAGSRALFRELLRALERHRLGPVVDRVFTFNEAPPAFRRLLSGAHLGKIVIRTAD